MSKLQPDVLISATPTPAVHQAKPRQRKIIRGQVGMVQQVLGPLESGCEIFALTNGQFSLIDVLDHVIDYAGQATIDLATWTAADGDLRRAHAFLLAGRVKSMRMIVDPSFRARKPEFCATLVDLFGQDAIRTVPLHGKFAVVRGERSFAIRSSMNLNPNRRIETVEISEDPALCDFLSGISDEIFAQPAHGNFTRQPKQAMATGAMGSWLEF
jgi:hypothetical protein